MKKIILLILVLLMMNVEARERVLIKHDGQDLTFIYDKGESLYLDLNTHFKAKMIVDDSQFSKKECRYFKKILKGYVDGRDPESISINRYLMGREALLSMLGERISDKGTLSAYKVVFLPFGVDLTDQYLINKLAKALKLNPNHYLLKKINDNFNFSNVNVEFDSPDNTLLSLYSSEFSKMILQKFSSEVLFTAEKLEGFKKGVMAFDSNMYETTCDLLHNGSSVNFKLKALENQRITKDIRLPEEKMLQLFNGLKKVESRKRLPKDAFVAGKQVSEAIQETGFKFPMVLKKKLGAESEITFYKSLFEDRFSWNVGIMNPARKTKILGRMRYVEVIDGGEHNGRSIFEIATLD